MSPKQEMNLLSIKRQFETQVDEKYRAGDKEHRSDLQDKSELALLDCAIEEAIDQYTFLTTLKGKMLMRLARHAEVMEANLKPDATPWEYGLKADGSGLQAKVAPSETRTPRTLYGITFGSRYEAKVCTLEANHTGNCNGWPTKSCPAECTFEASGL